MAADLRVAVSQVKAQARLRLPADVDALAAQVGHRWRQRKLTPAVTVWLFLLQVLHGNCAITALRHLGAITTTASSYCAARARLPLALFTQLFDAVAAMAAADAVASDAVNMLPTARRVLLGDSTTFSTFDNEKLRSHFRYPPDQRSGCGFPVGKLLAVIDAATGCALMAMGCPLFAHEARSMLELHPLLRRGDILVADRAFCSYLQIALLLRGGVDAVMHLHQKRLHPPAKDARHTWLRPRQKPPWMPEALWLSLPDELSIRIVRYRVPRQGYRTRVLHVATTLLDPLAYPPEAIARLYGHRWSIETCFNQLKTHAKMNALKSHSRDGLIKELIMYLIVWNRRA